MPFMTRAELLDPGRQPVTVDVRTRRSEARKGRYHRHPYTHRHPYMLIEERAMRTPFGKRSTVFSPLHGGLSYGVEEQMGQIKWIEAVVRDIATAAGIRDPIAHYEPGLTLPEVFAKYSAQVRYYPGQVRRLRSATAQAPLLAQLRDLKSLCDRIAPAFKEGAVPGERDRKRLGELVAGMRNFRKAWNAAKGKYGIAGAPKPVLSLPGTPKPAPPPPPKKELPVLPLALLAALALT